VNNRHFLYFAYGSNLHALRLRARVPSAEPVSIGFVARRRLAFHKRSIDGSAKADALLTDDPRDRIWGAIYRIDSTEKPVLDQHEFLGIGYDETQVDVVNNQHACTQAWMYVARQSAIDTSLKPYCWYLDYVIQGAYAHRLPLCYVAQLHRIEPLVDANTHRLQTNRQLLRASTSP